MADLISPQPLRTPTALRGAGAAQLLAQELDGPAGALGPGTLLAQAAGRLLGHLAEDKRGLLEEHLATQSMAQSPTQGAHGYQALGLVPHCVPQLWESALAPKAKPLKGDFILESRTAPNIPRDTEMYPSGVETALGET